ncbi:MAG TPA: hemolysin III family protein [Pseudobdellovibrionaceae bacterium]|nr:hemolysin III family protein [Pseudobdellovibrionaceae bacterium]
MYKGERFNSISHLIGTVLSIAAASVLITLAVLKEDPWRIIGFSIYGIMMITLYATSTLYHSFPKGPVKDFLRKMDHLSIYLMIAGTYTPFTLITLHGIWGWTIFGVIWGLALLGILQELTIGKKSRKLSILIYILMGWLIVVATQPLTEKLPNAALYWLLAGGLFYTLGILVYVKDEVIPHGHGIWHLFVLAGSLCHFACLVGYL